MKLNAKTFIDATEIMWNLDENGVLTLEGHGKIPNFDCGPNPSAPWKSVKDQIVEIQIMEGVTEIGVNAFKECKKLKKVVLPHSLGRIQMHAFWNCRQLVCIESERTDFKYVYDDRECQYVIFDGYHKRKDTVIFGIDSFRNVPWSKSKWGDFYCNGEVFYVTFTGEAEEMVIPEGIRVIKPFAMNAVEVDSVVLPNTLEVIEELAFAGSNIKSRMFLPNSIKTVSPYAFSDCFISLISFPFSWNPEKIRWKRTTSEMIRRQKFPEYIKRFSLSLLENKSFGRFRKMQVTENKEIYHRDGTVTRVRNDKDIDIGKCMYRRIRLGKVLLCVTYEDNKVVSVKSFAWNNYYELPNEYLMYPVQDEGKELLPWRDSFTYQERDDIVYAFCDTDGEALKNAEVLRFRHPDSHEEWFWSDDIGNFGGPLEMEFLEMWLSMHLEITVDSTEENMENDRYRWFVDV